MFQHITNNKFYHKSLLHQIKKVSRQYEQYSNYLVHFVSGQLPPKENCTSPPLSLLGLGFWSRLRLVLGLGATRKLPLGKIEPWVGLVFGLGAIFLVYSGRRTCLFISSISIITFVYITANVSSLIVM